MDNIKKIRLSLVVPFYNEEGNLKKLHTEILNVLHKLKTKSEIIYINDGSTDNSFNILESEIKRQKVKDVVVKVIDFNKNFGQTAAISAGIDNSSGDLVSFLDADLQNDPKDIPRFLVEINKGCDAVFGWRKDRKDATLRRYFSVTANKVINLVFNYPYKDVGCSAKMVKREYLKDLGLYGELHRVLPVLIYLKGAKIREIVVEHRQRYKGSSKYGFNRIFKTIIDITTVKFLHSYGTKPAYIFGTFGLVSLLLAGLSLLSVVYRKLILGVYVHRDPMFLITIFLGFLGIQFMLMGLLAELQIRTYFETQKKHIYEIRSKNSY